MSWDKEFILKHFGGRSRRLSDTAMEWSEKRKEKDERKMEIMGLLEERNRFGVCDDRVARDLGIAYHEVGLEEYEKWARKGF